MATSTEDVVTQAANYDECLMDSKCSDQVAMKQRLATFSDRSISKRMEEN